MPKGLWGCLGIGSAIVVAIIFGSAFGLNQSYQYLAHHVGRPDLAGLVVAFGAFGAVIAVMAWAAQRQAAMAARWPVVPGTISLSDEDYHEASEPGEARGTEMFGKRVCYTYSYQNVSYTNECARVATSTPSASSKMLEKLMARYQDGATVEVHVNPDNPAEATLDARGEWPHRLCVVGPRRNLRCRRTVCCDAERLSEATPTVRPSARFRSRQKSAPAARPIAAGRIGPRSDPAGSRCRC